MYNRNTAAENQYNLVVSALKKYKENPNNISAGYAILNYIKEDRVEIDGNNFVVANMFNNWGLRNPAYIWLRLAKKGYLKAKKG